MAHIEHSKQVNFVAYGIIFDVDYSGLRLPCCHAFELRSWSVMSIKFNVHILSMLL